MVTTDAKEANAPSKRQRYRHASRSLLAVYTLANRTFCCAFAVHRHNFCCTLAIQTKADSQWCRKAARCTDVAHWIDPDSSGELRCKSVFWFWYQYHRHVCRRSRQTIHSRNRPDMTARCSNAAPETDQGRTEARDNVGNDAAALLKHDFEHFLNVKSFVYSAP